MKKGFTLIELLAIITIMAIIALVVLPSVLQMRVNTHEKQKEDALNNLYFAAESYIVNKGIKVEEKLEIKISDLVDNDYINITSEIEEFYDENDEVVVTKDENDVFKFELERID